MLLSMQFQQGGVVPTSLNITCPKGQSFGDMRISMDQANCTVMGGEIISNNCTFQLCRKFFGKLQNNGHLLYRRLWVF